MKPSDINTHDDRSCGFATGKSAGAIVSSGVLYQLGAKLEMRPYPCLRRDERSVFRSATMLRIEVFSRILG